LAVPAPVLRRIILRASLQPVEAIQL